MLAQSPDIAQPVPRVEPVGPTAAGGWQEFMAKAAAVVGPPGSRVGRVAVLVAGVDRFRAVNDSFGHATGDAVLAELWSRIRVACPDRAIPVRLGGDEFALLLADPPAEAELCAVAHHLQSAVAVPLEVASLHLSLGLSVGIALSAGDGFDPRELLRQGHAALSHAKRSGAPGVCLFDDGVSGLALDLMEREHLLRAAVGSQRLRVEVQPEVDIQTGAVVGCEALLRWQHPRKGWISLAEDLEIAEGSGLTVGLGAWVLEQVCPTAARWRARAGDGFVTRVNMSPRELERPEIVATVAGVLERTGLPGRALCLEITESATFSDPSRAAQSLAGLRELGVELAVDDFGTGFNTLDRLRLLPVQRIKLAPSLLAGFPEDPWARIILKTVIGMVEGLGVELTVEGVENAAQHELLLELGCRRAQGYLFYRPMPFEAMERLVRRRFGGG